MRYTTIIDISEFPAIYRNVNARLMYLHLCLIAGYHDDDRDICDISIRRLAYELGMTLSAARHALRILSASNLITHQGSLIEVRKWISEKPITKRSKQKENENNANKVRERQQMQQALEDQLHQVDEFKQQLSQHGKTSFMLYYEMQTAKAATGDADAMEAVRRHRATYEAHCRQNNFKPK